MELENVVAVNIQRLMEKNHLTQNELGDYLHLSRQTISKYLKGKTTFNTVQLIKLAHLFRVPVDQLLAEGKGSEIKVYYRPTNLDGQYSSDKKEFIRTYIKKYVEVSELTGVYSSFTPEQYELYASIEGEKINVNRELGNILSKKESLDGDIEKEILTIADEQRSNLALNDAGSIALIPALEKKGIRIVFLDFGCNDISGASVCSETYGCFIFVNSNDTITVERQLYTVAHEYGHILLHRSLYNSEFIDIKNEFYTYYLDHMANRFAARLVSPPTLYYKYASELNKGANDLKSILSIATLIKHQVQLSLQSVMLSLRDNGYITKEVVKEYYDLLDALGARNVEPVPIKDEKDLFDEFRRKRNANVTALVEKAFRVGRINDADVAFLCGITQEEAHEMLTSFRKEMQKVDDFFVVK